MKIAILADPHHHDIHGTFGAPHIAGPRLRTLADTTASTRVFNESYPAFRAALADIAARGIRIVVIPGDVTDDGQAATVAATMSLLDHYATNHGMRFFATPGNHDLYSIHGRHQSKRFLSANGSHVLFTSDSSEPQEESTARIVTPTMHCAGYERGLPPIARLGYFRDRRDLHWESPFGASDRMAERTYEVRSDDGSITRTMVDASYLVEPEPGLWLLSIDANVFEPRDGATDPVPEKAYHDSTDAGWNAMLKHKRFVLDWVRDVTARARQEGKDLLVFSHYPMIDPLAGTLEDEIALFGNTSFARRAPRAEVARSAIAAGLRVHFSGHLHVNDTAVFREGDMALVNVAVPSLVGFPPAYKIGEFGDGMLDIETVFLDKVPGFEVAFAAYRAERARTGADYGALLEATSYPEFLSRHLSQMVAWRYLPREWPADLAEIVPRLDLGRLAALAAIDTPLATLPEGLHGLPAKLHQDWHAIPFMDLVVDWYHLRKARALAAGFVPPARLAAYDALAALFAAGDWPVESLQGRIAAFLRILGEYRNGQPSVDFSIDLETGAVEPRYRGRTDLRQTGSA
ncbi:metallophosphoesterase [Youhaiella tibetensis]|uniref:Metallophosphoesterase n=1 Tax=Paradevosia tibetensis TaxID=1447062 RepID=A0A5B9DKA2_9HYPH|nr:metallophosphoesterase [Youhaiella tibetensis]QEE19577.1 metallophosphoesterase [Youhaiella tibetensis]GGF31857.1 metallophosphoesterase [Youhaiella tibetensis]